MDKKLEDILTNEFTNVMKYLDHHVAPMIDFISEVSSHLYLSSFDPACDINTLMEMDIDGVLYLSDRCYKDEEILNDYKLNEIEHYFIPLLDEPSQDLSDAFNKSYNIITSYVEKDKKILIHCESGISRCATILCGYLLKRQYMVSFNKYKHIKNLYIKKQLYTGLISVNQYLLTKILKYIKQYRQCVYPNPGFVQQLLMLEYRLKISLTNQVNEILETDAKNNKIVRPPRTKKINTLSEIANTYMEKSDVKNTLDEDITKPESEDELDNNDISDDNFDGDFDIDLDADFDIDDLDF